MKKVKKLSLSLNKRKISELNDNVMNNIVGGQTYPTNCGGCKSDPTTLHCTKHYPGC